MLYNLVSDLWPPRAVVVIHRLSAYSGLLNLIAAVWDRSKAYVELRYPDLQLERRRISD